MLEKLINIRKYISNYIKIIKFKLRHQKLIKLSIEDMAYSLTLEKSDKRSISASPKYTNQRQYSLNYSIVDIKIHCFKNVFCNINSSSFITRNMRNIYIEEFPYIDFAQADYSSGFLTQHDSNNAYFKKIKVDNIKKIENSIFLGGNGSFNFYHWMIEIAPKLLLLDNNLLKKLEVNTILVNECVARNENYSRILENFSNHLTGIKFIYINQNDVFYTERIYFINTFNQTIYNYKKIPKEYKVSTIYNEKYLKIMKSRLSSNITNINARTNKKIFILRNEDSVSQHNNRSYNQNEVFDFFKSQGFIGVFPDKLTIDEQVILFKSADFIVGPTGASWSNLIFCNEKTKAISWVPKTLQYFDTYSSLAHLNKVDMRFITYEIKDSNIHNPYNIDTNDLIILYKSMAKIN